jgi:DNA-binding transcriptional regulator LsrR (DeoR family)
MKFPYQEYASTRMRDQLRLMSRCAQLFYKRRMTQTDIADQLKVSRGRVKQLLDQAEEMGLVRIDVRLPRAFELEERLRETFGLHDAIVAEALPDALQKVDEHGEDPLKKSVGVEAAAYFESLAKDGTRVALACGSTLQALVQNLKPGQFSNLSIYPLNVADGPAFASQFPNQLAAVMKTTYQNGLRRPGDERIVAFSFQVSPIGLVNGGVGFTSEAEKRECLDRHGLRAAFEEALDAHIYLIGIGSVDDLNDGFVTVMRERDIDLGAIERKALGEINYQPFGDEGFLTDEDVPGVVSKYIGVSWRHLQEMANSPAKHVIAVACGRRKVRAIQRSLQPDIRCYDILVTDEGVAREVLSLGAAAG